MIEEETRVLVERSHGVETGVDGFATPVSVC
jgi:hypothetical protein